MALYDNQRNGLTQMLMGRGMPGLFGGRTGGLNFPRTDTTNQMTMDPRSMPSNTGTGARPQDLLSGINYANDPNAVHGWTPQSLLGASSAGQGMQGSPGLSMPPPQPPQPMVPQSPPPQMPGMQPTPQMPFGPNAGQMTSGVPGMGPPGGQSIDPASVAAKGAGAQPPGMTPAAAKTNY